MATNRVKTDSQLLIEKFVKPESINWPRESKIIATLLKREPVEFWKFLVLGFKLNSLAWFNSTNGKKCIEQAKKTFLQLEVKKPKEFVENFEYKRSTETKKTLKDILKQ